ncbi:GLPGLI family protein [Maribacter polysiphoniae]|uniref:GLPGLI family protein n=1 Tax=Maribacter polysiphoniae TaxID=429344 RepID=A0A316DVA9_9FLAO|nr:GLPGLI family protein [Maribacter polysiphoniae]MBD1261903.1 GLPGLI family protein [Maribacter polysiphoniae]PWK22267.1 GLPGLI family protein [Maribacter polysiphoniae]
MKSKMLTVLFMFFTMYSGFSQDFQGKATYESKTQVNMDFGNRQIPEDRKKEIMERMKKANEKTYELVFNAKESLYEEDEKLEQPGGNSGRGRGFRAMGSAGGDLYKNIEDGRYLIKNELFGKIFLIEDDLEKLDWKLESDTKQIGKYTAYKAVAVKTVKRPNMQALFRRRNTDGKDGEGTKEKKVEEFIEKEVEIVAWYTPEIPINQGPADYWGLPGLILAVSDDVTTIVCSKITLNPKEKIEIKAPKKGKKVTQAEYDEISREKMKEMRENFRGGRGGGRGGARF